MKLISVKIENFKSIKSITIPLTPCGQGTKKSNTNFLVGLNESGKSAILQAISLISGGLENTDYETFCYVESQEDESCIDIFGVFEVLENEEWKKLLTKKWGIEKEVWEKMRILTFTKNIYRYKEDGEVHETYSLTINGNDLPLYQYVLTKQSTTVDGVPKTTETISLLAKTNSISDEITKDNAKTFLKDNQRLLTGSILQGWILPFVKEHFKQRIPKFQTWKANPDYLINEQINLNEFKEDPSISIPLKNIFHIFGKKTNDEIKSSIEKALKNQARRDELQERLSETVTKYVNRIWKEHRIKIRISINAETCQVLVEDKDKKFAYYNMAQRSDGFKQFISLILSISAQNESDNLKNNVILIDEPEVHLHPSGIKYMRDEILKIGKNNTILVSTHSQYMIDTDCPERHFIVTKNKSETEIAQLSDSSNVFDDNVLAAAFGLNIFKELLPKNIIVVEGTDDKNIITHCFNVLFDKFFFSIKAAGGASKMPGFARLLNDENISCFLLFDADKEGRDNKGIVLENQKETYSIKNVFTLKDILNTIPTDSTIEDLLPIDFVKKFFETELGQSFILDDSKAVILQLKQQSEVLKNKQKLDSIKMKLSVKFCDEFKSLKSIQKIDRINNFSVSLKNKIDELDIE